MGLSKRSERRAQRNYGTVEYITRTRAGAAMMDAQAGAPVTDWWNRWRATQKKTVRASIWGRRSQANRSVLEDDLLVFSLTTASVLAPVLAIGA